MAERGMGGVNARVAALKRSDHPAANAALGFVPEELSGLDDGTAVQGHGGLGGEDTGTIHKLAAEGVSGSGGALPYLQELQETFGPEADLSGIRAHVGGPAARAANAMGARAYARGEDVAFKEAPDLHTVAHEVTHVLQQRAGVQLQGGVGEAGDRYEREADAMGAKAVRGESTVHGSPVAGARLPVGTQRLEARGTMNGGAAIQFYQASTIDQKTYDGFTAIAEETMVAADDACINANGVANRLPRPNQARLRSLENTVIEVRNNIDDGMVALSENRPAPWITGDPYGVLQALEDMIAKLEQVTEAWQAVLDAEILEWLARVGEARQERARAVQAELAACLAELHDLRRVASGQEMVEAFAQTGINAALSVAVAAISIANPLVGVAIGLGVEIAQLTVDSYLGPSPPGAETWSAAGVSSLGTLTTEFGRARADLGSAGRRLGAVGAAAGTLVDVLESDEAIERYEQSVSKIHALGRRIERLRGEFAQLRTLLEFPEISDAITRGLRRHARVLRANGQVVLRANGQR